MKVRLKDLNLLVIFCNPQPATFIDFPFSSIPKEKSERTYERSGIYAILFFIKTLPPRGLEQKYIPSASRS
jgi:hypothetical protein